MNKIRLDSNSIKLMTFFETATHARVKDCISNDKLTFIIEENDMGKAIGKNGSNIRKFENRLKKKIKLVEYSDDLLQFVRNLIYPVEALSIKQEGRTVIVQLRDANSRAMIIGREKQNLNHLNDIAKRYFDIDNIKVT